MKRIPFSQVLKTAAIDIRREYDRLYGMFCVQKFQDMVGAGSSLKDYCATYFVRLPFRGTCVSFPPDRSASRRPSLQGFSGDSRDPADRHCRSTAPR